MPPRDPFDSSTEVLQIVLAEVRELRQENSSMARETRDDVRSMREELAETSGKVIGLDGKVNALDAQIREWKSSHGSTGADIKELRNDFEDHKTAEAEKDRATERILSNLTSSVEQVLPLAKSHEKVINQATGAIRATRVLWGLLAALATTGGFTGGFALSGGFAGASTSDKPAASSPPVKPPPPPPVVSEEIVLESQPNLVDGGSKPQPKVGSKK